MSLSTISSVFLAAAFINTFAVASSSLSIQPDLHHHIRNPPTKLPKTNKVHLHPTIPFGDINVVVLTDVHSWVAGHGRQEETLNADYGDVLSFYENLKAYCDENNQDLWFVSNGDFVDGTGLSIPGDPSSLIPVLQKMPLDALSCGNHELYIEDNVDYMVRPGGWADWWGERYLTSNLRVAINGEDQQLGHLYRYLKGNSNLLVMGFLYNMKGACESITVEKVEDVVKKQWFKEALTPQDHSVDAVLVLAHMDLKDPLVTVIREAIREIVGDSLPIQFITGHTHYRGEIELDEWTHSFEAGRYLDTVGFVSFPTKSTASASLPTGANATFQHVFMDANKEALAGHLGLNNPEDMDTENGLELSEFTHRTRQKMGLLDEIGCAPHDFKAGAPIDDPKSLWGLYLREVLPKTFFRDKNNGIMFVENEAWRYDLFSHSRLIVDDIMAVAPFNDSIVLIGQVPGSAILQLNKTMNHQEGSLPHYILAGAVNNDNKLYDFFTHDFNVNEVIQALKKAVPDHVFEPKATQMTSTLIWLDFVRQSWPCSGGIEVETAWIPSSSEVSESTFRNMDERGTNPWPVFLTAVFVSSMTMMVYCVFGCAAHTPADVSILDVDEGFVQTRYSRINKPAQRR